MDLTTRGRTNDWADDPCFLVSTACIWEATARKIGNVHRFRDFSTTTYADFLVSGCAAASAFRFPYRRTVGGVIEEAVSRSRHVTTSNTNLGIVLLLAPFARVEGWDELSFEEIISFDLRSGVRDVLARLTVDDAGRTYRAIRVAAPGGLGDEREQDVKDEPTVTLLETMRLAVDRDLIARQYANGFADVFDFGVPAFLAAVERFGCVEAAVIDCQLRWLAEHPDSLIVRKNGPAVAEDVRQRVTEVLRLGGLETPEGRAAGVELDEYLRSDGNKLNPGTTADLVTACLFVALREGKVRPSAPFTWDVPDWL